ncbi:hypothetical protein GURKE_03000 [Brevundimonas phage vB_BpoS-Gurke]|uniref:Uncharacterized protein n=1 Tax=Brevundimonas phage vB_BpoS-Gurke TaxID=2948599 RepID=A0A9E7N1U9_9CAUD|nr:hypothetical protein GURKE_03000 [Brevundimonas phage vB_BpoS-Gurke]
MTDEACIYLTAPEEHLERSSLTGQWRPVVKPERFLCAWATFHPDSIAALQNAPPWLVTNALAGHLVRREKDCPRCPFYKAGDPVE